jgi:histidyl-tRNA synthetase
MPEPTVTADGLLSDDRPLPEGVRDLLFADAAAWREMEANLRRTWTAWGYGEIILPTFEYADTLATDVGSDPRAPARPHHPHRARGRHAAL